MSDCSFRFREFTVHQEKCAMKVGTDGVLLGSWIDPKNATRILDIGSGTGLIALMLAQKSNATIDAVDIDKNAFTQSAENFKISPWFFRLHAKFSSFQEFAKNSTFRYDLIVTNPPYFQHASKPSVESRLHARHNDTLTFDELICGVKNLLQPSGRLCLILPCKEGMEFMDKAHAKSLYCHKLVRVKTRANKNEKRLLMEFDQRFGLLEEDEILIQEEDGCFTPDYIDLTKDYYINLRSSVFPQS